jgi:tetratricopeptide (TPR) repeat protein
MTRLLVALGLLCRQRGRFAWSYRLLKWAVRVSERRGTSRLTRAVAHNALGLACKDTGRYDEGRAHYDAASRWLQAGPQSNQECLAGVMHNIGGIEHARARYDAAEPFARAAVRLRSEIVGVEHPQVAADRVALGAILEAQERYAEAEELYLAALAVFEQNGDALELAATMNNLGTLCASLGQQHRAETFLKQALEIRERLFGSAHPNVAITLNNLGIVHSMRNDHEQSLGLYERALEIFQIRLGLEHPRTRACDDNRRGSQEAVRRRQATGA